MVDEVKVKIQIDSKDAKKALKEVKEESVKTGDEIEKSARKMSSDLFFGMSNIELIGKAVGKAFNYISDGIDKATGGAEKFGKASYALGISRQLLQAWSESLYVAGGDFNQFTSALSGMDKFLSGREFGSFSMDKLQAFGKLGISATNYTDSYKLLIDTIEELQKKERGERNQLADILGIPLDLIRTYDKVKDSLKNIETNSNNVNDSLEEQGEKVRKLKLDYEKLQQKIALTIAPNALKTVNFLANFGENVEKGIQHIADFSEKFTTDVLNEGWRKAFSNIANDAKEKVSGLLGASITPGTSPEQVKRNVESILKGEGFSEAGIAAVLGNMEAESSFRPTIENKGHYGLVQWDKYRQEGDKGKGILGLKDFENWQNEIGQTAFLIDEMKRRGIYNDIKNATNVAYATQLFEKKIEVSGGQIAGKRFEYAGNYIGGFSQDQIQNAIRQYYPDFANKDGSISQVNNITVRDVKEAGEFAGLSLGGRKATQATVAYSS